jgi:hypothetical protein
VGAPVKRPRGCADVETVEKRRKPRQQRRLGCELWIAGKRHSGFVRDVSEDGLYIQTRARATTGSEVELVFAADGARPELRVRARVARLDQLSRHIAASGGAGGLGLEVIRLPRALAPLLATAGFKTAAPVVKRSA